MEGPITVFKAVRFGELLAGNPERVVLRNVPGVLPRRPEPLRVGARMLRLFQRADDWRRVDHVSQVLTVEDAAVFSSAGITALPGDALPGDAVSGDVLEETLDHTDPLLDGYRRDPAQTLTNPRGHERDEGGTVTIPAEPVPLPGHHLSLLLGAHANHFHWLVVSLGLLGLLDLAALGVRSVLAPADLQASYREMLRGLRCLRGIPFTPVARRQGIRVDRLTLPFNAASGPGANPLAVGFLRAAVPGSASGSGRRIYVDCRKSPARRLLNEDELIRALRGADVEAVSLEDMSLAGQPGRSRCSAPPASWWPRTGQAWPTSPGRRRAPGWWS